MSIMNNKVNKSGDTMIGNLIINGNLPAYILQDSTLDLSQYFTDNKNDALLLQRDKNGKDGCYVVFSHDTSDINRINLVASNGIDENRKLFGMGIWCRKNGEHGTFAPQCNYDTSIVTTVSHGDNWIRFGNGLQICWGYYTGGNYNFPVPFRDANYMLSVTYQINAEGQSYSYAAKIRNKQNTFFECWINANSNYIAIGYWY